MEMWNSIWKDCDVYELSFLLIISIYQPPKYQMQDSSSLIASLQNTITLLKYKNKELTPEQEKEVITHAGLIVSIVQMDPDART